LYASIVYSALCRQCTVYRHCMEAVHVVYFVHEAHYVQALHAVYCVHAVHYVEAVYAVHCVHAVHSVHECTVCKQSMLVTVSKQ